MTQTDDETPLLDASLRVDSIPVDGRQVLVEATAAQMPPLAERLKVPGLSSFKAKVTAMRFRGGLRASGEVTAELTQECVVTFEPVFQKLKEPIDRVFLPGQRPEIDHEQGAEVFVDLDGEDLPDWYHGPELDLTDLLVETIALAINPYPRKPGAELPPEAVDESVEPSPFAALAALKSTGQ